LTVKWRQADSFVHVHYSIFSENTVNNALDSYNSGIIFSAMLGYWIWLETVDTIGFMGISLVIISGLAATWYVRNLRSAPNTSKG
jgi:hypothetical protein